MLCPAVWAVVALAHISSVRRVHWTLTDTVPVKYFSRFSQIFFPVLAKYFSPMILWKWGIVIDDLITIALNKHLCNIAHISRYFGIVNWVGSCKLISDRRWDTHQRIDFSTFIHQHIYIIVWNQICPFWRGVMVYWIY